MTVDTQAEAHHPCQQHPDQDYVNFSLNNIKMQKQRDQLPMALEALLDLARIIPGKCIVPQGPDNAKIVACRQGPGDEVPDYTLLSSNKSLQDLWSISALQNHNRCASEVSHGKSFIASPQVLSLLGLVLAVCTGSSFGLLPSDVLTAIKSVKGLLGHWCSDKNAALEEMTHYAAATVLAAGDRDDTYLSTTFMEDARSYFMVDSMETSKENKVEAVEHVLTGAKLPSNISEAILKKVKFTTSLQKQHHDFSLDTNGRAMFFSVNIWMKPKGAGDVQIALMLCGSEFTQSRDGVDEIQYEEVTTKTARWWTGWEEIKVTKHPVTIDGVNPLTVKVERRVTDPKKMKPGDVQQLKDYLVLLASKNMLQNNAPHKLPVVSGRRQS